MGGEPIGASVAMIVAMLGAWLCAMGIGAYVVWASMRSVGGTSSTQEGADVDNVPNRHVLNESGRLNEPPDLAGLQSRLKRLARRAAGDGGRHRPKEDGDATFTS